jgi:hypothetical protein
MISSSTTCTRSSLLAGIGESPPKCLSQYTATPSSRDVLKRHPRANAKSVAGFWPVWVEGGHPNRSRRIDPQSGIWPLRSFQCSRNLTLLPGGNEGLQSYRPCPAVGAASRTPFRGGTIALKGFALDVTGDYFARLCGKGSDDQGKCNNKRFHASFPVWFGDQSMAKAMRRPQASVPSQHPSEMNA